MWKTIREELQVSLLKQGNIVKWAETHFLKVSLKYFNFKLWIAKHFHSFNYRNWFLVHSFRTICSWSRHIFIENWKYLQKRLSSRMWREEFLPLLLLVSNIFVVSRGFHAVRVVFVDIIWRPVYFFLREGLSLSGKSKSNKLHHWASIHLFAFYRVITNLSIWILTVLTKKSRRIRL